MPVKNISGLVTDVSTTQQYPLGLEFEEMTANGGRKLWIYVQVEDAGVPGDVMSRKLGATTKIVVTAPTQCAAIRVVGVVQHAIPDNSFGWIQREGIAEVKTAAAAGVTADTPIVVGATAGRIIDTAAGAVAEQGHIGVATETVAAATLATCHISCRG